MKYNLLSLDTRVFARLWVIFCPGKWSGCGNVVLREVVGAGEGGALRVTTGSAW